MRSVVSPLIINSGFLGNHENIFPESDIEFYVSVINQGEQHAVIEASIEIVDELSQPLEQWFNPRRARLALAPREAQTVLFQIFIPAQAWPSTYLFDLIIDSPEHYPEYTPLHYPHSLKVRSPLLVTETGKDPSFFLSPVTTSTKPKIINPGEEFEVEIVIDNSSYLVDRFHVVCRDLDPKCYSIRYPEIRDQYGLIIESDGLELNPGCQGNAWIRIHPPLSAEAGKYFPTISLKSSNNSRIDFLDIIYFDIPVVHDLQGEIEDVVNRIKNPKKESGRYKIDLSNKGNTQRNFRVSPKNRGWGRLELAIDTDVFSLKPADSGHLNLTAKPVGKWWNRPFFGMGKTFKFGIELEDLQGFPVDTEGLESELLWEAYPKKWMRLLITLLVVLGVAGAIGLALLIWNLFFKQPPAPKVLAFNPDRKTYSQDNDDLIRLHWRILNAKNLRKIIILQKFNDGTREVSDQQTFEFRDGKVPTELVLRNPGQKDNICEFKPQQQEQSLVCEGITTRAKQPGNYQFELQLFDSLTSRTAVVVQSTDTIRIQPASVPNVSGLSSAKANYMEPPSGENSPGSSILLNWEIRNPSQIQELKLAGSLPNGQPAQFARTFTLQDGKLPKELEPFCKLGETLICQNFPTGVSKAGSYIFRLSVTTRQGQENPSLTRATDPIEVKPRPTPSPKPGSKENPVPLVPPPPPPPGTPYRPPAGIRGASPNPGGRTATGTLPVPPNTPGTPTSRPQSPDPKLVAESKLLERGLGLAKQRNMPDPNGQDWRGMEKAVSLLRSGFKREESARRAGVTLKSMNELIRLARNPNAPSTSPEQSGDALPRAPEPIWQSP